VRTGADNFDTSEYEEGTLASIDRYFNTFDEPFIKGLLRDKGEQKLLYKIESKQKDILYWMQQLSQDYKKIFQGMPVYLYLKREKRRDGTNRMETFTLLWRVSRSVCGTGDNTMITQLFSGDGKNEYLLRKFGPGMRLKLREYDARRLSLNMAESLLRYQKRSIMSFYQATGLDS
jgi:hypothetical protein